MATLLYRNKGDMFFDNSGKPLSGGQVYFYQAGTNILQATFSDSAGSVPNTNPIALNGAGRLTVPVYFGSTYDYKELVTDSFGATVNPWPFDDIPCAAPVLTTQQIPVGTPLFTSGIVAPSGFVLASGRTIGNAASGAAERANADTQALFVHYWGADASNAIYVVSAGRGASALQDFAAGKTITILDVRGRAIFGLDNMGGSAASRLTNTLAGGFSTPTVLGSAGGSQGHTLTTAQLAAHSHTYTDPGHHHNVPDTVQSGSGLGNGTFMSINAENSGDSTIGITIQNTGGDAAHNNIPPGLVLNCIVKL